MNWQPVYDVSGQGAPDFDGYVLFGLALLAVAGGFWLRARRLGARSGTARVLAIFALLVAALGYGVNTWDRNRLASHLAAGRVLTVEGPVFAHAQWREDITYPGQGGPRRYQNWERIVVGGITFIWAPGAHEAAFTNAQTPPLALRDGLWLRVTWVEDAPDEATQRRIVKLEAADPPPAATAWGVPAKVLPDAPYPSVLVMPGQR
ncbi:hypothetical protein [Methyloversatilis sp.]|uniref:hypothetical protein n=1 Tax=Methyloversatilis sp. TaxID=2569862 RepID=UPI0035B32BFC